jgi:hypothetical protein
VTAEAVGKLFAHVVGGNRDDEGMGGDRRGAAAATCKIAGIAYTASNRDAAWWLRHYVADALKQSNLAMVAAASLS